jgi:hypothetical protein
LAFYIPWDAENTSQIILNGGQNVSITGTVLVPRNEITANGGANFKALNSQVIARRFIASGNGDFEVAYDPGQNWGSAPAASPTIELIK